MTRSAPTDRKRSNLAGPQYVAGILRRGILSGTIANGTRLSSVRELVSRYHVSRGSALVCYAILEKERLVEKRLRSGVYVIGGGQPAVDESTYRTMTAKKRVEEIADDMATRISLGDFKSGEHLPIRKALQYHYKTSSRSMNQALKILETRGFIFKQAGKFLVGPTIIGRKTTRTRIAVLGRSSHSRQMLIPAAGTTFFPALEKELCKFGVLIDSERKRTTVGAGRTAGANNDVLGLIRPANHYWVSTVIGSRISRLETEIRKLARSGKPTVLIDPWELLLRFPEFSFRPFKTIYPLTNVRQQSAEKLAVYMAEKGHRHVAFFSYSTEAWNRFRLNGTIQGMQRAWGNEATVENFGANFRKSKLRGITKKDFPEARKIANKTISRLFSGFQFTGVDPVQMIMSGLFGEVTANHHRVALRPLFEKAIQRREITAWICADPSVAEAAHAFLAEKEIPVPARLSMAAIDDNHRTLNLQITAYDLQRERMGYLAAHCLLGDIPIARDKRGVVECPGQIIERGTVGRV